MQGAAVAQLVVVGRLGVRCSTAHLFDCPENPTLLTVDALWSRPRDAAIHLGLLLDEAQGKVGF